MILLSHGEGSNLLEHIRETMSAGKSEFARAAFACHDIGKATTPWQAYIRKSGNRKSPHPHAGAGALLAAALLHRIGATPVQELAAMHCIAAHHSDLSKLTSSMFNQITHVENDAQEFFLNREWGIASLMPQISDEILKGAWDDFKELCNEESDEREELAKRVAEISDEGRLEAYLLAREWLGALCYTDRVSAQKQSGNSSVIANYVQTFAAPEFQLRPAKQLPTGGNKVYELRSALRNKFLDLVNRQDALFTFLDAPTGMGKTETMLQAAELIRNKIDAKRIIYAVPQVSIADQIFEDYFNSYHARSAQIWNYRRKEKTADSQEQKKANTQLETDNTSDRAALLFEAHPFRESYNITTFNQVLLSSLHPARARCVMTEGMRDAVIIMDEFHKLPMTILPLFFPAARAFAKRNHCRFLFGSATPFELLPYWFIEDAACLDKCETAPLYAAEEINMRREYTNIGTLTIDKLTAQIEERHEDFPEENLLVVVNLVKEASWPLRQHFTRGYQPWMDLERMTGLPENARRTFVLDGLTPPILRRDIVVQCREAMKHAPVTLIATQMVEVGVDLDFDRALCDYQGLASVIQRGGRVGREGRGDGKPRPVEVFSLITSDGKTSFEELNKIERKKKYPAPLSSGNGQTGSLAFTVQFRQQEVQFFNDWDSKRNVKHDSDLTKALLDIQRDVFQQKKLSQIWETFFSAFACVTEDLGCSFENAQYIAEIGGDSHGEEILVVPTSELYTKISELDKTKNIPEKDRKFYLDCLTNYRIRLSDEKMLIPLGLDPKKPKPLTKIDNINMYLLDSPIW